MTMIVKVNHGVKDTDIVCEQKWQAGHMGDHPVCICLLVGVSPSPFFADFISELRTVNGAKITGELTAVPVIFLSPVVPVPVPKVGRYLPLQSKYPAFLFSPHGTVRIPFSFLKASPYIQLAGS